MINVYSFKFVNSCFTSVVKRWRCEMTRDHNVMRSCHFFSHLSTHFKFETLLEMSWEETSCDAVRCLTKVQCNLSHSKKRIRERETQRQLQGKEINCLRNERVQENVNKNTLNSGFIVRDAWKREIWKIHWASMCLYWNIIWTQDSKLF
jgi:hypothetical protein